jgi:hypothetical protein
MSEYSELDKLTRFVVRANEDTPYRQHFLNNPVEVIEEDVGIPLTDEQKEKINELKHVLNRQLHGIANMPVGVQDFLNDLKRGGPMGPPQDDDSVIL